MSKTIIIAEAGVNHNGDINKAVELIEIAAKAGADFVKFQTFIAEYTVTKTATKAEYQQKSVKGNDSQYEMIKALELSFEDFKFLYSVCEKNNIHFLSTGFDLPSLDFLESLDPPFYKIPSGEITNYPYLKKIAGFGKPVIISTGMAILPEIKDAIEVFIQNGIVRENICVLHCNTEYPTPLEDVNLKAMNTIGDALGVKVGYSDHTLGIEVPIAAVALGATVIEKHFTIDKNLPGPDHAASLEPKELQAMVKAIRNTESAISGTGEKLPSKSEIKNTSLARKSIVAQVNIRKDEYFTESNITTKRPGTGLSPMKWNEVIGQKAKKDFLQDQFIEL